jgi:hypothetical protein
MDSEFKAKLADYVESSFKNQKEEITNDLIRDSYKKLGVDKAVIGRSKICLHQKCIGIRAFVKVELYSHDAAEDSDTPLCCDLFRVILNEDGKYIGCEMMGWPEV